MEEKNEAKLSPALALQLFGAAGLPLKKSPNAKVLRTFYRDKLLTWDKITLCYLSSDTGDQIDLSPAYICSAIDGWPLQRGGLVRIPRRTAFYESAYSLSDFVTYRVEKCGLASSPNTAQIEFALFDANGTELELSSTIGSCLQHDGILKKLVSYYDYAKALLYQVRFLVSRQYDERQKVLPSLLIYGPRGVGKTSMIQYVADVLEARIITISPADLYYEYYDVGDAVETSQSDLASGATCFGAKLHAALKEYQPCIILIDDIDVIFPKDDGAKDIYVIGEFISMLQRFEQYPRPESTVLLVGITSRPSQLDSFIRKRFLEETAIDVPTLYERGYLLISYSSMLGACNLSEADLFDLASKSHGYVQADIHAMIKHACYQAYRRFMLQESQAATIEMKDFEEHRASYRPVAVRESSAVAAMPQVPRVQWDDIGGLYHVKYYLQEMIVWPLKHADAFRRMGVKPPSGLLLHGPPGTGKTLLAKAVASASQANFFSVNISDLIKSEIGESEKTLAEMFRRAKLAAPSVIFFDEIQAMFGDRSGDTSSKDYQKLVSQLLIELDGIHDDSETVDSRSGKRYGSVVVIAATNVPQSLDSSLMRPGRLERLIYVSPPDAEARTSILRMTLGLMKLAISNADEVAALGQMLVSRTEGYSGADLVNLCHQAGLIALMHQSEVGNGADSALSNVEGIKREHFERALEQSKPSATAQMLQAHEQFSRGMRT